MLKLLVLAIAVTLCLSQDPCNVPPDSAAGHPGDDDYIACDDCQIPDGEFPQAG